MASAWNNRDGEKAVLGDTTRDLASPEEFLEAFEGLSGADALRLEKMARNRAKVLKGADWQDVFQESIRRCLAGTRPWPKNVALVPFLGGVMRSVAEEMKERQKREPMDQSVRQRPDDGEHPDLFEGLPSPDPGPAERADSAEEFAEVEALFADDEEAWLVATARAEGFDPAEIQSAFDLSATQYASILKRIRRKWLRHIAGEDDR